MKLIKKLILWSILIGVFLISNQTAWADTAPPTIQDLGAVVVRLINFLFAAVGGIAVLMIVVGGFKFMTAAGDPKATDSARATITYAIIGLVITLLSVFIINIVGGVLGVGGLSNFSINLQDPRNFFRSNEVTPVSGPR